MVDDIERKILYLMHCAFIDIRSSTVAGPPKAAYVLSDIFHTIPLELLRARDGERSYSDIYAGIRARAENHKALSWIDSVLEHF